MDDPASRYAAALLRQDNKQLRQSGSVFSKASWADERRSCAAGHSIAAGPSSANAAEIERSQIDVLTGTDGSSKRKHQTETTTPSTATSAMSDCKERAVSGAAGEIKIVAKTRRSAPAFSHPVVSSSSFNTSMAAVDHVDAHAREDLDINPACSSSEHQQARKTEVLAVRVQQMEKRIRYLESTLKSFQDKLCEVSALTSILQLHPDEGDSSLGRAGPQELPKQRAENLSDSAHVRVVHNHGAASDQSTTRVNPAMKNPKNINLAACCKEEEDPIQETLPGAGDDVTPSASCGDGGEFGAPRGPSQVFVPNVGDHEGSTTCSEVPKFRLRQQVYALEKMKWKCDGTQQSLHSKLSAFKVLPGTMGSVVCAIVDGDHDLLKIRWHSVAKSDGKTPRIGLVRASQISARHPLEVRRAGEQDKNHDSPVSRNKKLLISSPSTLSGVAWRGGPFYPSSNAAGKSTSNVAALFDEQHSGSVASSPRTGTMAMPSNAQNWKRTRPRSAFGFFMRGANR
ncbi:unnamed protein product [Amoebophrya sp. A120]|nr:unnamed protein product [Amoebophrya sp. A120]|eukprot:GSA120T00011151001.1